MMNKKLYMSSEVGSKLLKTIKCISIAILAMTSTETYAQQYVDLGLPSGTLWCNLNIGSTTIKNPGKKIAPPRTQEYVDGTVSEWDESEDPASRELGEKWRTPSQAQLNELFSFCTYSSENDVQTFTGPNGNKIKGIFDVKNPIWTRDLVGPNTGTNCYFASMQKGGAYNKDILSTSMGTYIRPVANKVFNFNCPDLIVNDTLKIDTFWIGLHKQNIKWISSNVKAATIDANGIIKAVGQGSTIIMAKSEKGATLAEKTISVYKHRLDKYIKNIGYKVDTITLKEEGVLGTEALKLHNNLADFKALVVRGPFDEYDWKTLHEMENLELLDISGVVAEEYPEVGNENVKYVVLSEWIDVIENNPYNKKTLEYIYVPDNVTELNGTFHSYNARPLIVEGCKGVVSIGESAFHNSGVRCVLNLPNLRFASQGAFSNTSSLIGFIAPKLHCVENELFAESGVMFVDVPSATSIEADAFYSTTSKHNLRHINMPSVKYIADNAFYNQESLEDIDLTGIISIGAQAFMKTNVKNAVIPMVVFRGL